MVPWFQEPGIVAAGVQSHYHDLLGHFNRTEPLLLLMLLVTPVLFMR